MPSPPAKGERFCPKTSRLPKRRCNDARVRNSWLSEADAVSRYPDTHTKSFVRELSLRIVRLRTLWLAALLAALTVPAQAHFIWLSVEPGSDGKPEARVWFGEDPSPGAEHLVPKVAHTKVRAGAGDAATDVELK